MKRFTLKRLTALLLSLTLVLSLLPAAALAADDELKPSSEGTIKLTVDVTTTKRVLTVESGQTVTLDLNGHDISSSYDPYTISVEKGGKLTIIGKGTITNTSAGSTTIRNYGELIIGEKGASDADSPTVTRNKTTNGAGNSAVKNEEDSILTIWSGTFEGDKRSVQSWGTTYIHGGTFKKTVEAWTWEEFPSNLNISGGTFEDEVEIRTDAENPDPANIAITGGAFAKPVSEDYLPDGYIFNPLTGEVVGGGEGTVADVTIMPSSKQTLDVEETVKLTAVLLPSTATDPVTWTCEGVVGEPEDVATVDENGVVTAIGPGTVKVCATAGGVTSDPVEIEVSGVILDKTSLELVVGQSASLVASAHGNAEDKLETWSSSNMSVAGVKNGKISTYNTGTATITYQSGSYKATCEVTVVEDLATAISKTINIGEIYDFEDLFDDLKELAKDKLDGAELEYLNGLSVATGEGILYYGYNSPDVPGSGVGATQTYYLDPDSKQKGLADVVFVPADGFGGTAIISYTASGGGKTFNGTIRIEVINSGDVVYSTARERLVSLKSDDFAVVCRAKNGRTLRNVTFTLPAASKGTLYYNYSPTGQYSQRVSAGAKYQVTGGSTLLDNVSFLPAAGFTGTVTIPYVGTDSSGATYPGVLTIIVYDPSGAGSSGIEYHAAPGGAASFDREDFADACGGALHYVIFKTSQAAQGTLYYGYTSPGVYEARAGENDRYFYKSSDGPAISELSFVLDDDATGAVTLPFTAYDTRGNAYEGSVLIRVDGGESIISYTTGSGGQADFDELDFNELCQKSNSAALSSVSFKLPPEGVGTLYRSSNSEAAEDRQYSRSALSGFYFEPVSGFTGVVSIPFTGTDANGETFEGTVQITVTESLGSASINYGGSSLPVRFDAQDFRDACAGALSAPLSHITFRSLPDASSGKLLLNYGGPGTGTAVTTQTNYYNYGTQAIGDLYFLAKSGFQGHAYIYYTAVDIRGNATDGSVRVTIYDGYLPQSFNDTANYAWAAPAIEFLYEGGVTLGDGNTGGYSPGKSIIRGDFLLMLDRIFEFRDQTGANFKDVPASSYYAQAILDSKALGIATADAEGNFKPGEAITRQDMALMLYKAMKAAGRQVTTPSDSVLSNFQDGAQVAWEARTAMAYLIENGIIRGDNSAKLTPNDPLTRAELAVILHRLLTL